MTKIEKQTGKLKRGVRNRMCSVNKRVIAIALSAWRNGEEGDKRHRKHYCDLRCLTRQILNETQLVTARPRTAIAIRHYG